MAEKWATREGTDTYFQRIPIHPDKLKRFDGLAVSSLGAGTYLGASDDATDRLYEHLLSAAGMGGVNFFDTAINYRCMRSERVLRKAIEALAVKGVSREQIAIATKGGYLPCEGPLEQFEDYVRIHFLDTKIIGLGEIVADCHCMSPPFLENQIATSLENLGLDCIDLYYLHNPETQLDEVGEEEFYRRLAKAFLLFEKKVEEKKIRRYGVATWNGFRTKKGSLQLEKILRCAREAGGEGHHFKAVQIPYNLVMLEAIKMKNQLFGKEKITIAEAAKEMKIAMFVSAPFMQAQVAHLCPRVFERLPSEESPMLQSLQFVLSTPSIGTAFAGMKQMKHWEENRKSLLNAPWSSKKWEAARTSLGLKPE